MKKRRCIIRIVSALALALILTGCSGSGGAGSKAASGSGTTVAQLMEDAVQETAAALPTPVYDDGSASPADATLPPIDLSSEDADVDLTKLSSTLVFTEVSRMMYYPDEFIGKTIKMAGAFSVYESEKQNYYACIVADATACCANGIEFEWAGEHAWPEDYPPLETEITVVGTFELYEEDGFYYSRLADAQVSF